MNVLLYQPHRYLLTETFIRAHAEHLPCAVTVLHGYPAHRDGELLLPDTRGARAWRKVDRVVWRKATSWEMTRSLLVGFRRYQPDVVLAEYGPSGVLVREACEMAGVPLVVCFHGFDGSVREVLKVQKAAYERMFSTAFAVTAPSRAMTEKLRQLGAGDKAHFLPYGVDVDRFLGGDPAKQSPTFLAVGRFVEKKAPYLTLAAFAQVRAARPQARLRFVGEGPLLGVCRDLSRALGVDDAVTFLGALPPEKVARELRAARAFVQHSMEATDGDSEGMPVAILEAGASGLPTIATRHAGIRDCVEEGRTGILVDEKDVTGMAQAMIRLVDEPMLAAELGQNARRRIETQNSMQGHVNSLMAILRAASAAAPAVDIRPVPYPLRLLRPLRIR